MPGIQRLGPLGVAEIEPFARGIAALHSPHAAAVDFVGVCEASGWRNRVSRGEIRCGSEVTDIVEGTAGVECRVGTALPQVRPSGGLRGTERDSLARKTDSLAGLRIIPFRGEYTSLQPTARFRVRGMIYPVPDPRYPFLGVHLTRGVDDAVHVGPNAVFGTRSGGLPQTERQLTRLPAHLVMARHVETSRVDTGDMALQNSPAQCRNVDIFSEVRTYLPDLELVDMVPAGAGVRAQAIDKAGELVDNFVLQANGPILVVRHAPSPAATSSLAIAEHIVSALATAS